MQKIIISFIAIFSIYSYTLVSEKNPVEVYFTRQWGVRVDKKLLAYLDMAKKRVYCATFVLSYSRAVNKLIELHKRGVDVRIVADDEAKKKKIFFRLINSGIPVVFDGRRAFMHNKFIVIDDVIVWTGSCNITANGIFKNNNNTVVFYDRKLAQNYEKEFFEMFSMHQFGRKSPRNTDYYYNISGLKLNLYFSPEIDVGYIVAKRIRKAKKSIYFMVYSFTHRQIARAMVDRYRKGILVKGVIESRNVNASGSVYRYLRNNGIDVRKDGNRYAMHHKVIIIDGGITFTGSFNFTKSASKKNDENLLIIYSRSVASIYKKEFDRIFARARF